MSYYSKNVAKSDSRVTKNTNSKKKTSTFSKYNVYKNRSSKQQANQIYQLNKKMNDYIKATKPETQIDETNAITQNNLDHYTTVVNQSTDVMMWSIVPPRLFTTFKGKLCRIANITVRGQVHTEYSAGYPSCVRLIFFQCKDQLDGMPLASQIVNYAAGNNASYENGPLKNGVTSNFKILGEKKLLMSPSFYRSRTFKVKLTNCDNFRADRDFSTITVSGDIDVQTFPSGSVFCLALFSNQGFNSGTSSTTYPTIIMKDVMVKTAYVDQN